MVAVPDAGSPAITGDQVAVRIAGLSLVHVSPAKPSWVFCSEVGTPLDLSNVTKAWRRVLKKAKLPAFRLYDLRHTFATTLLAEGAPLTYVAAQMGHTKPTTTLLWYAHWLPRGDKHWVDALDGAGSQARGSQLVANSTEVDASVVEVIERLEPTVGLEPTTCRLRREDAGEANATEPTLGDATPPVLDGSVRVLLVY